MKSASLTGWTREGGGGEEGDWVGDREIKEWRWGDKDGGKEGEMSKIIITCTVQEGARRNKGRGNGAIKKGEGLVLQISSHAHVVGEGGEEGRRGRREIGW